MKKLYFSILSGALMFGASVANAEEPTLTKDWSFVKESSFDGEFESYDATAPNWNSTDEIRSKMCIRFGTAMDGKIYVVNQKTMSIAEVTETGEIVDCYKLPPLDNTIDGVADFYGCALTHDDAGNFLVGHYFTKPMSTYVWTIYQPSTGKYRHFYDIETVNPLRIDCVGRVTGDLTKFAVLYVGPVSTGVAETQRPTIISFVNFEEDGNLEHVEASAEQGPGVYLASKNCTYAQPMFDGETTYEMWTSDKIKDTFMYYSAAYGNATEVGKTSDYWSMGGYWVDGVMNSIVTPKFTYSGLTAFDTFVLNGTRYIATYYVPADEDGTIPAPYTDNKGAQSIGVFTMDGTLVASWNDTSWLTNFAYSSLFAQVIDDNTAIINSYLCSGTYGLVGVAKYGENAIGGCKLTFTAGDAAGISDVIADSDNAPAVYYNLQGVEVANPENGIYIVRRGNKVAKELVK